MPLTARQTLSLRAKACSNRNKYSHHYGFTLNNNLGTNAKLQHKAAIMRKNTLKGKEKLSHYK